ncbi:hypothetical protein HAX54_036040 [Datura stramonium]|uniref:Uncharacterized protein n=1 Tax=Datura stramonium TaxID=4076 RepID=A0ABS8VHW4_DATST|nr:hypothetical protein [Datura stramonium]
MRISSYLLRGRQTRSIIISTLLEKIFKQNLQRRKIDDVDLLKPLRIKATSFSNSLRLFEDSAENCVIHLHKVCHIIVTGADSLTLGSSECHEGMALMPQDKAWALSLAHGTGGWGSFLDMFKFRLWLSLGACVEIGSCVPKFEAICTKGQTKSLEMFEHLI